MPSDSGGHERASRAPSGNRKTRSCLILERFRYYQLTTAGRKQLAVEMSQFERISGAITPAIEAIGESYTAGFAS